MAVEGACAGVERARAARRRLRSPPGLRGTPTLDAQDGQVPSTALEADFDRRVPARYTSHQSPRQGDNSETLVTLRGYTYTTNTADGVTIHLLASVIEYTDAHPLTTTYAYTFYAGTNQILQRTTTLPVVITAQNGSDVAATRKDWYDELGNLAWSMDELGFLAHYEHDPSTGVVTRVIQDVDTTQVTDEPYDSTTSQYVVTPAGGGQHLVTDYTVDELGRTTQVLGPAFQTDDGTTVRTATWTSYLDATDETRTAQGYAEYNSGNAAWDIFTLVGPITITKYDLDGRLTQSIAAEYDDDLADFLDGTETPAQADYCGWSVNKYTKTRLTKTAVYFDASGASGDSDADGFVGVEGTHYNVTETGYEDLGDSQMYRQNSTVSAGGTITRVVLDARGLVQSTWIGTNDAGATDADPTGNSTAGNNMVLVAESIYDGGAEGGNGLLTTSITYLEEPTAGYPVTSQTQYGYTDRDQLLWVYTTDGTYTWDGAEWDLSANATGTYSYYLYDLQGRVVQVDQYWDDDEDFATAGPEAWDGQTPGDDNLIARSKTLYDNRGRVYRTIQDGADPSDGSENANSLVSNTWYDDAGNVIKSLSAGSQAFTKTEYDGLGRAEVVYVGYDLSETTEHLFDGYGNVDLDLTDDAIFEQYEYTYDTAGHLIGQITSQRLHDATGTGELSDGSQPKARLSYGYYWYDGLGRQTAAANYGAVAGTPPSRPTTPPSSSSTVLVTTTEYNDRGEVAATFDSAGRESRVYYDDAGRVVTTIQNYVDGDPETGYSYQDVTTETTYTADGQVATYTAVNPDTGDQVTQYVYGTTLAESGVARADLLRAIIYPDSDDTFSMTGAAPTLSDGADETYDRVEYTYNRAGRAVSTKDQNETVHDYIFDALGRLTDDCVTDLDASLDDAVLRISRTYEVRGMLESITSWDDPDPGEGDEVNQVVYEFDDFGQLTREYQEHAGAKDANTPYVEYHYADGSDNHVRLEWVEYPNGRLVHYTYGATDGAADVLSRLDAICDDDSGSPGDVLAAYTYLGLGTIVIEDYQEPDVKLDLFGGTTGTYAGLDRFGRVVVQNWYDYGESTNVDQFTYGYDLAGNRLYRENTLTSGMDELYSYDAMNQLVNFQRGDLNVGKTAITGTIANEENFTLDATGNWSEYEQKSPARPCSTSRATTTRPTRRARSRPRPARTGTTRPTTPSAT